MDTYSGDVLDKSPRKILLSIALPLCQGAECNAVRSVPCGGSEIHPSISHSTFQAVDKCLPHYSALRFCPFHRGFINVIDGQNV